jgi:hypothetical protein
VIASKFAAYTAIQGIRTYTTIGDGLKVNKLIVFPAMPVFTLAGPENVFYVELLRPFVSVNRHFVIFFAVLVTLKIIENTEFLLHMLRPLNAHESGTGVHAKHARKELMRTLRIYISSLFSCSACESVFPFFKYSFCIPSACV